MARKPSDQKRAFWLNHINSQRDSGLSRPRYCKQHGLNYDLFGYYAKLFAQNSSLELSQTDNTAPSDFIPLSVVRQQVASNQFKLTHPDGSTLSWTTEWNPTQVLEFVTGWRV